MLAVVLALLSALGYGCSDFAAGLASRRAGVIQVTLVASVVSAVLVAAVLPFVASRTPTMASLAWGFAAGAAGTAGTAGAFGLYLGFRLAAFSVAGPISAVGFSVLAGLALGERPSALALTGIALALPAIVGVSAGGGPGSGDGAANGAWRGLGLGLIAGAGFAGLFIGLDEAGPGSGLWPVAAAQAGEVAAVTGLVAAATGLAAAVTGLAGSRAGRDGTRRADADGSAAQAGGAEDSEGLPDGSRRTAFQWLGVQAASLASTTGVCGGTGTILYFYSTQHGFLAVTAVLTSLYPAITIVLARTLLGERLTRLRLAGLVLAGACVTLIAVGGAS